nr:hypothetical protein [Pseudoalteromonas sp. WY3]
MFTSKLYKSSPVIIQSAILSIRALIRKKLRENKDCEKTTQDLTAHEYNYKLLKQYCDKTLSKVVVNASANIVYYHGAGTDINTFPFIDKIEVNIIKISFYRLKSQVR